MIIISEKIELKEDFKIYWEEFPIAKLLPGKDYLKPEFSLIIEGVVKDLRPISYLDAIVHYCEKEKIEIETVSRLISKSLKEKIQAEAINANLLNVKKGGKLPV